MYKKGHEKREEIYQNAKQLLYEKGYIQTTIKNIAQKSQTPISLVHYYFNKKDDIINCIYKDYLNQIHCFLCKNRPEIFSNTILSHAVLSRIYYDIILSDDRNRKVHYEILMQKPNYETQAQQIVSIYKKYTEEFQVDISEDLFYAYIYLDFGARRELLIKYFDGKVRLCKQELISSINGLLPRLLKIDQTVVDNILLESLTIFNMLNYQEIKFLV